MIDQLYFYRARALRVVDGDTLWVEIDLGFNTIIKEFVRLYDIDTPEVYGKYASPEGKIASLYTNLWLRNQETTFEDLKTIPEERITFTSEFVPIFLDCRKYDPRDKYGRALGAIYKESTDESLNQALNRMQLKKGRT